MQNFGIFVKNCFAENWNHGIVEEFFNNQNSR